jgi:hypothetical protein
MVVGLALYLVGVILLFICARLVMARHRPNRYFGHRNKWTLVDREVWDKTHKITGYLLMPLVAVMFMLSALSKNEVLGLYLMYILLPIMVYLVVVSVAIEMYSRKAYLSKHGHLKVSAKQFREFEETMILQEEHIMLGISAGTALGLLIGNFFMQFWLGFFLGMIVGFAAGVSPAYFKK